MTPRRSRAAALALAAGLLVAACGDDDDTTATVDAADETTPSTDEAVSDPSTTAMPQPEDTEETVPTSTLPGDADQGIHVTVADGSVEGGGRHEVPVGDTVAIVVTSDVVDEVHVHGYDVYGDIGPGEPTTILVDATIPGVWEVELHDSGLVLLELAVS